MKGTANRIALALRKIYPAEIITAVTVLAAVNYFYFPEYTGFFIADYNPYFIVIIFFSCFYGKLSGIFCFILSVILIASIITISGINSGIIKLWESFISGPAFNSATRFIFLSFIFSVIMGEIRDSLGIIITKHKNKIKELESKEIKLEHEIKAITLVNEEYQDRILGQQNSLISLYSTMIALNSLDMGKIYPNILEAVVKFSGAIKCSLWEYMREERKLKLLAHSGWAEEDIKERILSDSSSITGWVARNNEVFSVKLLQKHNNLLELDTKQNIITIPIIIDNRVWGVINIEEIPFIKYNLYSEQLIMMIADLAAPIISNAIRFDEINKKGEIDLITGLPSLDEMFSTLKEEYNKALNDNTKLSLVIFEITNSQELTEKYSDEKVLSLLKDVVYELKTISRKDAMFFQYKEKFQFSMLLPNMDYDGAAMQCLSFIEKINTADFKIDEDLVQPEIILGYSSMRPNLKGENDLMMLSENLLEMQKI
ncbi:MAG: GAF domain-containing protein [Spirochaetes bacterium]|nr:GAF domain-containing protein [Spirochaetota bacterium]